MGAAALMAVSFGLLHDIKEIKGIISVKDTFKPNLENTAVYDKIFPYSRTCISTTKIVRDTKRLKTV